MTAKTLVYRLSGGTRCVGYYSESRKLDFINGGKNRLQFANRQ